MEDEENYEDDNMDIDQEDYYNNEDNNNEVNDELENLFIEAANADDPIEAYKNVIEMETSNSSSNTMTIRSLKELCKIYLLRDDYKNFCIEIQNLLKSGKTLKEEIFKTKLFDEILSLIEQEQNKKIDCSKYLIKMYNISSESEFYTLSQEIKNFTNKIPIYNNIIKEEKKFLFNDLINDYKKLKEQSINNNKSFLDLKIAKYESMTINKQIPLIKNSLINWKNKNAKKFWTEWVDDYEKFSDLPIFYDKMKKTETCKIIGFNILNNLYDDDNSIQTIGFNASMFLFDILSKIFNDYDNPDLREYTVTSELFSYILKRLQVLTEVIPRKYKPDEKNIENKENKEIAEKPVIKKKKEENKFFNYEKGAKGIGYSSMIYGEKEWDIKAFLEKQEKHRNFLIESIIAFFSKFFNVIELDNEKLFTIRDLILESALLSCIENLFADNTPIELEKNSKLVNLYFEIMKNFSKSSVLYILLKDISKDYKPIQNKSLYNLSKDLINTISLYTKNLNNAKVKNYSALEDIIIIFNEIENNLKKFEKNDQIYETSIKIIDLTKIEPEKAYPLLLKKLVFDYTTLPEKNSYKNDDYYFYDNFNYTKKNKKTSTENKPVANQDKILRLIGEFSNLQNSLPVEFTNSIFVRVDKDNIDHMTAIIFGSTETPYSSGAFTFDIKFGDNYPQGPPHVIITSTGNGTVRFNPNLYSGGKVCLSLLGTWRGTQGESWNPEISNVYQVLVSIQSIIMSDLVYFNEPGYENLLGTKEGNELNEGYSNIVRYNNIRVCMIDAINNPPKGFENVIKIHFYLKKEEILKEVDSWIERAQKVNYKMDGLISSHNSIYSNRFKDRNNYLNDLIKIRAELKTVLDSIKLDESLLKQEVIESKIKKDIISTKKNTNKEIKFDDLDNIDMSYDNENINININNNKNKAINEDMLKDRYSRYIGALGLDAVHKQSNATIFLSGCGALGIEIAKNIVLSGCKELILHDTKNTSIYDITGQFYLNEKDIGYNRAERSISKLQELNYYVKITLNKENIFKQNLDDILLEKLGFKQYNVIILTECDNDTILIFDSFCRKNNIYLIICDVYGCIGRLINDFGNNFEVIDKDGESIKECYIQNIFIEKNIENNKYKGIISINKGLKHGFEDGDLIEFYDFDKNDKNLNVYNIFNKKKFNIKIKSNYEFIIDNIDDIIDIKNIEKIIENNNLNNKNDVNLGKCRQVKQIKKIDFNPIKNLFDSKEILKENIDSYYDKNLLYSDFSKIENKYIITQCFNIINEINKSNNSQNFNQLISNYFKNDTNNMENIYTYVLICKYYKYQFPTLAAFFGGLAAQEAIKSITKKFMPINQYMVYDCLELIDYTTLDLNNDLFINEKNIINKNDIIKSILGPNNYEKLQNLNLFQIGAGAIGCELIKNYATLGISTGINGKIFVTDPDVIEVSNLTRQFLFREKHLRLPKSSTAAAAAVQMNPDLKGHIFAKSEKLCEESEYIFSDKFFKKLNIVTNALDNVNARKYVDLRCTNNKICLLESGTLGPKGHVQVIIPYKTENYSSQEDPSSLDNDDIPQCTLKMFPEEAIHCLEWARDQFGKNFTIFPQNFNTIIKKIQENEDSITKDEYKKMKTCLKWIKKIPKNLEDCVKIAKEKFYKVFRNNINKLLLIYPLDKKDKDGNLFWSLPKRPPQIVNFDIKNKLCIDFIAAYSYLIANMFNIKFKYKNPKDDKFKDEITIFADRIIIKEENNNDINNINNIKLLNAKYEKLENLDKNKNKENIDNNNMIIENDNNTFDNIEFNKTKKELLSYIDNIGPNEIPILSPVEFEKDNDYNGQIDLIYSMSGLRCLNYNIEPFDWITCKLKAGKIIPALSTTTSCISALQTLELLKIIKNLDIQNYRNTFLNLAIPIIQSSEPGNVINKKICGNLYANVWDMWEININIKNKEENSVKYLFDKLIEKYGIYPKNIFLGKKIVYIYNKENNNIESLSDLLEYNLDNDDNEENYVDISVTFTEKEESKEYLKNIPKIRVYFNK